MKCIKYINTGKVIRVSDKKAYMLVNKGSMYTYTNKKEWKDTGRER